MITRLLRFCDKVASVVVRFFWAKSTSSALPAQVSDIAFIKVWAIGEAVLTLPAIQAVAKQYPQANIAVFTTEYVAPVYSNQPFIKNLYIARNNPLSLLWLILKNQRKFDVAIDLEPYLFVSALLTRLLSKRTIGFATAKREKIYTVALPYNDKQHVTQTYLDLVAPLHVSTGSMLLIPLAYQSSDEVFVQNFLEKHRLLERKFVMLAPSVGGSAKNRQWPPERFAAVGSQLIQSGFAVIVMGSNSDRSLIAKVRNKINGHVIAVTDFSLTHVAALLEKCHLLIANDSGLMHVGAAMGTPTLGLFGPNLPLRFAPLNNRSEYLYHPCPGSPHINIHKGEIGEKDCPCMQQIPTNEVLAVSLHMLGSHA